MPLDKKQYNRDYYEKHREDRKKNYEENAPVIRERSRIYANDKWKNDPEYRKNHAENTIRRTRIIRQANSITKYAAKILAALKRIS